MTYHCPCNGDGYCEYCAEQGLTMTYHCPCNGDGYCAYCAEHGPDPDRPGGGYGGDQTDYPDY